MRSFALSLGLLMLLVCCKAQHDFSHDTFEIGVSNGILDNRAINEASGLAASIRNEDMLWTHNDSGGQPWLFLVDKHAHYHATLKLPVTNRDWEDIAVGPGPGEKTYIYVGEIGDNAAKFDYKYIYRLEEPKLDLSSPVELDVTTIDSIKFQLPDGKRDTEAIMVDPLTKDLYVFSKREKEEIHVYVLPFPQSTTTLVTARFVMKLAVPFAVAADMSTDGSEILVKNYNEVYYWKRANATTTVEALLAQKPTKLPYAAEPQGEAITFDRNGEGYYTLSEESDQKLPHLMFYQRKKGD